MVHNVKKKVKRKNDSPVGEDFKGNREKDCKR